MDLPRRRVLHLAAGAAVVAAWPPAASAQNYPSRYVRLVVPFPPGGGGDALGRPLANRFSELWGQQVVIENKGGAAGNIGAQAVSHARAAGLTLLLAGASTASHPVPYP